MENFTLTQRGRECFVYDGFVFTFDRSNVDGDIKFWRCQAKNVNCKARLHTRDGEVIKMMNVHNHDSVPIGYKMRNIKKRNKRKLSDDAETVVGNEGETETGSAAPGMSVIDPLNCSQVSKRCRKWALDLCVAKRQSSAASCFGFNSKKTAFCAN